MCVSVGFGFYMLSRITYREILVTGRLNHNTWALYSLDCGDLAILVNAHRHRRQLPRLRSMKALCLRETKKECLTAASLRR